MVGSHIGHEHTSLLDEWARMDGDRSANNWLIGPGRRDDYSGTSNAKRACYLAPYFAYYTKKVYIHI